MKTITLAIMTSIMAVAILGSVHSAYSFDMDFKRTLDILLDEGFMWQYQIEPDEYAKNGYDVFCKGKTIDELLPSYNATTVIDLRGQDIRKSITYNGTEQDDLLIVGTQSGGHITYYGLGGNDCIIGGSDTVSSSYTLEVYGGSGDDTIYGSSNNDILYGGLGKDTIYGLAGEDILVGGAGKDTLDCGIGTWDTVQLDKKDTITMCERSKQASEKQDAISDKIEKLHEKYEKLENKNEALASLASIEEYKYTLGNYQSYIKDQLAELEDIENKTSAQLQDIEKYNEYLDKIDEKLTAKDKEHKLQKKIFKLELEMDKLD